LIAKNQRHQSKVAHIFTPYLRFAALQPLHIRSKLKWQYQHKEPDDAARFIKCSLGNRRCIVDAFAV
jgi:hypothetical protein